MNNSVGQAGAEGDNPKLFLRFYSLNIHSLNYGKNDMLKT